MGTHDPEDFFPLVDAAFRQHPRWRRGKPLSFSEDLLDAEVLGAYVSKIGGDFFVALNEGRLLASLLAGPPGCGTQWARALLEFLEAVDGADVHDATLTVAQIVDQPGDVQ